MVIFFLRRYPDLIYIRESISNGLPTYRACINRKAEIFKLIVSVDPSLPLDSDTIAFARDQMVTLVSKPLTEETILECREQIYFTKSLTLLLIEEMEEFEDRL